MTPRDGAGAACPTRTTCPYCGVGCGVVATPDASGAVAIAGDPDHPANFGRLCSKGSALGETLASEGRLLAPQIAGGRASWEAATDLVAERFTQAIRDHGPESVAFYVSGQLLTEDYYVANKLMKGFIGAANIDTNSRLCMASSVAGHKRAFGSDTVPGTYEDLEDADLVVLVGSNLAWCHPVLHQRLTEARTTRGTRIVTIDPRRTATAENSDLHLAIMPGGDVPLFNGLLAHLEASGAIDSAWTSAHVSGLAAALAAATSGGLEGIAAATGLDPRTLAEFYDLWARTPRVVTVYSQGVNQAVDGSDKVNAILNCHLATGRIGRPGCGPFSVTGQPNAMGGREVGGLANMLANHLELADPNHRALVKGFWDAPTIATAPGLKAVDLFEACADGRIKALWIMCTNPAVSMPDAAHVSAAIEACDFVAVSDIQARTDTTALADVLLPATGWGEKDGTVTNSERRISRQRAFRPAPGAARHDWQIVCDVARAMGFGAAFDYAHPAEIFAEYAALSALAASHGSDLDLSGLAQLDRGGYDSMAPVQWPVTAAGAGGRFFAGGGFFTPDGKARMVATPAQAKAAEERGFVLNTGRVRDHWHTMTRTAKSPRLSQHMAEPFLELHPADAEAIGLRDAEIARVDSARGSALFRARLTTRVQRGQVFAPMHWTAQWASGGRANAAVEALVDPISGQPALKSARVRVAPAGMRWYGFGISRAEPAAGTAYWAKARMDGGWRIELAGDTDIEDWDALAADVFGIAEPAAQSAVDKTHGTARLAYMRDGELEAALFAARGPVEVSRAWLAALYSAGQSRPDALLAGRPAADLPDPGATVCVCFSVGAMTIRRAVLEGGLISVAEVGAALQAGTNCGSCKPEIQAILDSAAQPMAAE